MSRMMTILLLCALSALAIAAVTSLPRDEGRATARDIALGADIYAENCASCHGANLEGAEDWRSYQEDGTLKPPPHDASGHTWHHTDDQLFTYTKLGGAGAMADMSDFKSGMPAFDDVLTDDQIRAVLDYIKSTWPENIREAQAEMSRLNSK